MVRSHFAALLILIFIFQPILADAQDGPLRELLHNIPGEVERFVANVPEARLGGSSGSQSDEEEVDLARMRARIRNLPLGAEIQVVVRGGERFEGELAEATSEKFALSIKITSRGGRLKKRLRYEDVDSFVLPESNGWMPVEKIQQIEKGKRIEVLLVDDTKVKGRLSSATAKILKLDMGRGRTQDFSFGEVASVRNQGMQTGVIVAIVGAGVGAFLLIGYFSVRDCC